jgi:hypothetical protein
VPLALSLDESGISGATPALAAGHPVELEVEPPQ